MAFGDNTLSRGSRGAEVAELQIRLSGFRGDTWDGAFGPGTEMQVMAFQRDFMKMDEPTGLTEADTFKALDRFAKKFALKFEKLKCLCGQCEGFGKGKFKDKYRAEKPKIEMYYKREYPGIHKAILHSYSAAKFYAKEAGHGNAFITCGYRCWINNEQKGRKSTNHMGKAVDLDFPMKPGDDKKDDCERCDSVRSILVEKCNFQIGWGASNKKALEPSRIAPSWVHMDVRCFNKKYLADKFFVKNMEDLLDKNL